MDWDGWNEEEKVLKRRKELEEGLLLVMGDETLSGAGWGEEPLKNLQLGEDKQVYFWKFPLETSFTEEIQAICDSISASSFHNPRKVTVLLPKDMDDKEREVAYQIGEKFEVGKYLTSDQFWEAIYSAEEGSIFSKSNDMKEFEGGKVTKKTDNVSTDTDSMDVQEPPKPSMFSTYLNCDPLILLPTFHCPARSSRRIARFKRDESQVPEVESAPIPTPVPPTNPDVTTQEAVIAGVVMVDKDESRDVAEAEKEPEPVSRGMSFGLLLTFINIGQRNFSQTDS
jgi:hypothetical protein